MANPLADPRFKPLPADVLTLLNRVSAPPRLIAHIVLVHDVACTLVEELCRAFPELTFDKNAVVFGAAIHDIGKTLHPDELIQPGKAHEGCGLEMLVAMGINEDLARFAYTHGNWNTAQDVTLEDLLVALADNCWKGKRVDELETRISDILTSISGRPMWDCYAALDDILGMLAVDADDRLEWQRQF